MGKSFNPRFLKKEKPKAEQKKPVQAQFTTQLFIAGVNTPVCVQLLINKIGFTMGKAEACDGVLDFNEEISREHCNDA